MTEAKYVQETKTLREDVYVIAQFYIALYPKSHRLNRLGWKLQTDADEKLLDAMETEAATRGHTITDSDGNYVYYSDCVKWTEIPKRTFLSDEDIHKFGAARRRIANVVPLFLEHLRGPRKRWFKQFIKALS